VLAQVKGRRCRQNHVTVLPAMPAGLHNQIASHAKRRSSLRASGCRTRTNTVKRAGRGNKGGRAHASWESAQSLTHVLLTSRVPPPHFAIEPSPFRHSPLPSTITCTGFCLSDLLLLVHAVALGTHDPSTALVKPQSHAWQRWPT
jgi:hypothetical protein